MIRQAAVAGLTLMPFGVSVLAAYISWEAITGIMTVWRMIIMTFVWIGAFAGATRLFWKVVESLASK